MAAIKVTDRAAIRRIFGDVAQRNQSLDLVRQLAGGEDLCRSRFVEASDKDVLVEVPSRRGHMVPVRPGEDVEVYFRLKDRRYWFASRVESRSFVSLSSDLKLPVLTLRQPQTLTLRQRRRHYRVKFNVTAHLMAGLWLMADPPEEAPASALPSMEALDLSAGGVRLLYPYGEGCPVDKDDLLTLSLPLWPEQSPVSLAARVIRVSRVVAGVTHIAVTFTDLDESPEGRMTRDKLVRFVTQREREELQRMH